MYTQHDALALYTELRRLERWIARLETLPAADPLRVLLPAVRDRVALLTAALAAWCDAGTFGTLDDLLPADLRDPPIAAVPVPSVPLAPLSRSIH